MASPLRTKTFYERTYNCHYYSEDNTYIKNTRLLFERVLKQYSLDTTQNLINIFTEAFSSRVYTGPDYVYTEDRQRYKSFSTECFKHLFTLLEKEKVSNIMDNYEYNFQLKGFIHGIIESKNFNLHLSFTNLIETEKVLDFAALNSYIYNEIQGLSNDCLVMAVPINTFYVLPYTREDYTLNHGYLRINRRNKIRRRGTHCRTCKHDCKPLLINGLDRLRSLL